MIKQSLLMLSLLCVGSTFGMGWGWGGSVGGSDQDKMDQYDADHSHQESNCWPNDSREELGMDPVSTGFYFSDYSSSNDTSSNSDDNTSSQEPISDSSNQDN